MVSKSIQNLLKVADYLKTAQSEDARTTEAVSSAMRELEYYLVANGIDRSQFRIEGGGSKEGPFYGTSGGMEYAAGKAGTPGYGPGASIGYSFNVWLAEPLYNNQEWKDWLGQWLKNKFPPTFPAPVSMGFIPIKNTKTSSERLFSKIAGRLFFSKKNDELLEIGKAALEEDDMETVNEVLQELYSRSSRRAAAVQAELEKAIMEKPEEEPELEEPEPEPEPEEPVYLGYQEQQQLVREAIAKHRERFGEFFGLRAFPGRRFTISTGQSFYSSGTKGNEWYPEGKPPSVQIVLLVQDDKGDWVSFGRDSAEILTRESVKLKPEQMEEVASEKTNLNKCAVFVERWLKAI